MKYHITSFIKENFILFSFIVIFIIGILIEVFDQICPGKLPFPFNFWEAMTAIGTIGAVFVAIVNPILESKKKKKRIINRSKKSIRVEMLANIYLLYNNGLAARFFLLEVSQYKRISTQVYLITERSSAFKSYYLLNTLYTSFEFFNERMLRYHKNNDWNWKSIKEDLVKHLLLNKYVVEGQTMNLFDQDFNKLLSILNMTEKQSEDEKEKYFWEELNNVIEVTGNIRKQSQKEVASNGHYYLNLLISYLYHYLNDSQFDAKNRIDNMLDNLLIADKN